MPKPEPSAVPLGTGPDRVAPAIEPGTVSPAPTPAPSPPSHPLAGHTLRLWWRGDSQAVARAGPDGLWAGPHDLADLLNTRFPLAGLDLEASNTAYNLAADRLAGVKADPDPGKGA